MSRLRTGPLVRGRRGGRSHIGWTWELWGELRGGGWAFGELTPWHQRKWRQVGRALTAGVRLDPKPGGPCEAL